MPNLIFQSCTFCVREGVKKKRIFYSQADRNGCPSPPLYGQLYVIFFCVLLTLCYDYMCSETDFTQGTVNFHATTEIPDSSPNCCCPPDDHLQEAGPSGSSFARGWPLRIIICKRQDPHFDKHKKGMRNAFLRPLTMRSNVF